MARLRVFLTSRRCDGTDKFRAKTKQTETLFSIMGDKLCAKNSSVIQYIIACVHLEYYSWLNSV